MPRRMMRNAYIRDGRNPYGSRGGYVVRSRRMRRRSGRDRAMDENYEYDERSRDYRNYGDTEYDARRNDYAYSQQDNARNRNDYEQGRQYDMDYDFNSMRGRDGHYPMGQGSTYYPIEAMGRFSGYYGMGEDYERGGRGMSRGRGRDYDYNYDMDYGDYGDYGETLSKEELEKWNKKLMKEMDEKEKQYFSKQNITQKAKQLGVQMQGYSEDELLTTTLMMYTDYCKQLKPYVGSNMDIYVVMAKGFLEDKDASVKGGEKLAVYYDCIVEDEE